MPRVIVISLIKEINELNLNLEEVEVYYSSNNLELYSFTSFSKIVFIKDIDTTFADVL